MVTCTTPPFRAAVRLNSGVSTQEQPATVRRIDAIHDKLKTVSEYPEGVVPLYGRIEGTSFFPGGDGLWKQDGAVNDLKVGGVMVVGHNFDNVSGFDYSLRMGAEPVTCPTWRNITKLLKESDVRLEDCYFTNIYIGLMKSSSNVGTFPGSKSEAFKRQCLDLLEYQILLQQPSVILTLGAFVPPLFARLTNELNGWLTAPNLSKLDSANQQIIRGVNFCGGSVISTVVALTHPALRHLNVPKRFYCGLTGNAAEIALIRSARAC